MPTAPSPRGPPLSRTTKLRWARTPQQARSRDTLERLLDAAQSMLEEGSWDDATVAALVARAKSSVGAFYARFGDKDALLQQLHERRTAEGAATADAALSPDRWRGLPLEEVVRALVVFTADDYAAHPGLHCEIVRRNSVDARFRARSARLAGHVTRLMAALLEERGVRNALDKADLCHRVLFSVFDQAAQFSRETPGAVKRSHRQLADAIAGALLAIILGD